MNTPTIILPPDVVARCWRFAEDLVDQYRSGRNENSRAFSRDGIESNVPAQAHAKMGECACAAWLGIPLNAIHWTMRPDHGSDLELGGCALDIKTIKAPYHYLIWPISKIGIYASKRFDHLVLIKGDGPAFWPSGFIDKQTFDLFHHVARDNGLQPGTWFMHERELIAPWWLRPYCGVPPS